MDVALSGITIDCTDVRRVADFWAGLLGGELTVPLPGWLRLEPGDGAPHLSFQPVPEPKRGKVRVHLDLVVDDLAEAERVVTGLGGRFLDERHEYDEGTVQVAADPEGTELCLTRYT